MARIETSECLKAFFLRLYPAIDLDSVSFYDRLPFYVFWRPAAITLGLRVYFKEGKFDPCSCEGIALIAHELFHIRQGSNSVWYYVRYTWRWLTSGFKSSRDHPLEVPAYAFQKRVREACDAMSAATGKASPCLCQDGQATVVDQAFTDAFFQEFTP